MEDDDEFGDLYTDVLAPFTKSAAHQTAPIQSSGSISRPIDLNVQSDDEEILYGAPNSNQKPLSKNSDLSLILNEDKHTTLGGRRGNLDDSNSPARGFGSGGEVKLPESRRRGFEDESEINVIIDERKNKDENLAGRSENFGVEEVNTGMGESEIPGLSIPGVSVSANNRKDADYGDGDDCDSDSEDDLQIVLNDNNHGPMAMDGAGVAELDDDDEDGEPLVIVADNDQNLQQMEEQDWAEDAAVTQGGDGERKELGDAAAKINGVMQPQKAAYGYHHPFHSQFKYVRPGAAPIPGGAPVASVGAPGQIRPPVNMGPIPGRGRVDWRPVGMKNTNTPPMQKSFHPGYGMPWGASGHGFGRGLDFTLPSHRTIFEVDIDSFEEKPWRVDGIDISDFFNFGLNEESWKDYCKQLEQLRLEATMQSKIRVYESGRTEQEYDLDMPPELAAAAGIHDVSSENATLVKAAGQSDLAKGSMHLRTQLPTGKAIQVETGYGERLPSIDTRPPRLRDSDAIIEIVLQDSADDSFHGNDIEDLPDNDTSREDLRGGREIEENNTIVGREPLKDSVNGSIREVDGNLPFLSESPIQYHSDSREKSPVYPDHSSRVTQDKRQKGRAHDRSSSLPRSGSLQDEACHDNLNNESAESFGLKRSPPVSSHIISLTNEERDFENKDAMHDKLVLPEGSSEIERENIPLNMTATSDTPQHDKFVHSMKKQELGSHVEQTSLPEIDNGEDSKTARGSESSKARSGSSREYRNLRDGVEEEVIQDGGSTRMGIIKRPLNEDEHCFQSKGHGERRDVDRHRMEVKGRDAFNYRKSWDPNSGHHSHNKRESIDPRKESDNSHGAWQRKDEDPHGRKTRGDVTRRRDHGDELGSRHRSKVRENERSNLDEYQLRKQSDNSSWRGHHDIDTVSRHRDRGGNLKTWVDSLDDLHGKRRKEEVHLQRDLGVKEELPHKHRENASSRKRERDDISEQRKRDDIVRLRSDDQHSVRNKEEGWFHRERVERQMERDEWQRLNQFHEESLLRREREDAQGGVRSGRTPEEKEWSSHSRVKDEYKSSDREHNLKDPARQSEQLKRRDRMENESISRNRGSEEVYARGNQLSNDERRSRHERASTRNERSINASDNHRMQDKKHKDNARKSKESEGDLSSLVRSRRNHEDHIILISERIRSNGMIEQGSGELAIPMNRQSSRKHKEDACSDDEQLDSKRGRSRLERWTSHKERDFSMGNKSSNLNMKETEGSKKGGTSYTNKLAIKPSKPMETDQNSHPLGGKKDVGDTENNNIEVKHTEDIHLDTVAKLKKRSERFKLPMPSEKEAIAIKKMENEPLPSAQTEIRTDSEIKQERPARKRRWTGN